MSVIQNQYVKLKDGKFEQQISSFILNLLFSKGV